nr:ARID DNA-binding domain-containing protein [Tanacetum cinerariifolium]
MKEMMSKKCYMVYLDVFVSYYKTARAPVVPVEADVESSLESYQWTIGTASALITSQKGKDNVEHFDIKLEDEPDCIQQQTMQHEEGRVTCYRCHSIGHYAYQCLSKQKNHMYFQSYKDSSSSKLTGDSSKKSSILLPFYCFAVPCPKHPFDRTMAYHHSKLEAYWPYNQRRSGHIQQWYQSKSWKAPRKLSKKEYYQRQIKREREERLGRCVRQITQGCKGRLRKTLEEIKAFNSSIHQNKLEKNNPAQPEVTLKYLEFIYFTTNGILKGVDQGLWDDFWYLSRSTDKHYCSNLNMFCNIRENFLVSKLEKQKKFLFTYGMEEVIIKPVFQAYLIPGVYYAPEVSLNILSIDLLNQQGFEVVTEGDRYRLEYMFKDSTGNMLDLNKLRNMQNSFIEDYFEGVNQNRVEKKDEMARFVEDVNPSKVHTFKEFVGFLNLIKNDDVVSKGWDSYTDRFIKCTFWPRIIAEILRLTRNEGDDVKKCYMFYLDVFVSYYKTARAPVVPAKADVDSSLESYQWTIGTTSAPMTSRKGKEKVEHFDIKLEDEPDFIQQQTVQHEEG